MEEELNKGLTLLKKGQKGLVHAVFSRMGLILLLLVLHVLLLFSAFRWFANFLPHIYGGAVIFTVGMVLYLLNSRMDPSAKITWLIVVMLLPVFGALLFWYTQSDIGHRALKDRLNRLIAQTRDSIPQSAQVMERLAEEEPGAAAMKQWSIRSIPWGCAAPRWKMTAFRPTSRRPPTPSTSPACCTTSLAAPAAPSPSAWWRSWLSTPTLPASRKPAAT